MKQYVKIAELNNKIIDEHDNYIKFLSQGFENENEIINIYSIVSWLFYDGTKCQEVLPSVWNKIGGQLIFDWPITINDRYEIKWDHKREKEEFDD